MYQRTVNDVQQASALSKQVVLHPEDAPGARHDQTTCTTHAVAHGGDGDGLTLSPCSGSKIGEAEHISAPGSAYQESGVLPVAVPSREGSDARIQEYQTLRGLPELSLRKLSTGTVLYYRVEYLGIHRHVLGLLTSYQFPGALVLEPDPKGLSRTGHKTSAYRKQLVDSVMISQ